MRWQGNVLQNKHQKKNGRPRLIPGWPINSLFIVFEMEPTVRLELTTC